MPQISLESHAVQYKETVSNAVSFIINRKFYIKAHIWIIQFYNKLQSFVLELTGIKNEDKK